MAKVNLLGVKIDDITSDEALEVVKGWVTRPADGGKGKAKHYIVTPNPEFLVAAQEDLVFRKILNDADLSIPDGAGLKLSGRVKNVVYGIDFMEKLVALSEDYGFTVGLLGGKDTVAKRCAECLRKKYPKVRIVYTDNGGVIDNNGEWVEGNRLAFSPIDILFVAFGHIKQEKWIKNNLNKIPVKVAMGVGGAFDYLSGDVLRAPQFIRVLGFEWLFRLILQPWRIKRQLALIKYVLLI